MTCDANKCFGAPLKPCSEIVLSLDVTLVIVTYGSGLLSHEFLALYGGPDGPISFLARVAALYQESPKL